MTDPALRSVAPILRSSRMALAHGLARVVAAAVFLLGFAGLVGHIFRLTWLVSPAAGWPAIPLLSSVGLVTLAVGLWNLVDGDRWRMLLASAFALAMCATALLFFVAAIPIPAGGLTVASVLIMGAAALALYVSTIERRSDVVQLTMLLAGFVLVALSLTVIFARSVGVAASGSGAAITGASLQTLISGLLMGTILVVIVWARGITITEPPAWLPVVAGAASLMTVLFLWRALEHREQELARSGALQALDAERRAVLRELDGTVRSMRRAAERAAHDSSSQEEERNLRSLVRDIPSLDTAMLLRNVGRDELVVPGDDAYDVASVREAWQRHAGRMPQRPGDTVSVVPLDQELRYFAIVAPICDSLSCVGALAGIMRAERLFAEPIADTLGGYRFTAFGAGAVVAGDSLPEDGRWVGEVLVRAGGMHWALRAASSGIGSSGPRTELPAAVLFMGLVVTGLLPVPLRLGRTAWRSARQTERSRLSAALERATDGIWEWDLITGMAARSPALWTYLHYDPARADPYLQGWTSLVHPEDRERVENELESHIRGQRDSFEAEYRVLSGKGDWHTIVDRGRVVDRDPAGRPVRMLGISADVTEARRANAAREASERRFRAIFDSGFQFQLLLDCDGKVLEVNRTTLDRAGLTAEQVTGLFGWEALWWKDDPAAQQLLREACTGANGGTARIYEQRVQDGSGRVLEIEIAVKPILNAEGKATQILVEARDVTEARQAAATLQEVDTLTAMGRVAARVAHEINNPLAGIQNSFLLIKDAVPEAHPHHKYVGAIEREIGRIAQVTRQLYETYRPETESTGDASLHTVVGDAVAFLEQVNRLNKLVIETDLNGVPSTVPLSAAMLRQIIYNLVQNAADASPPGARIKVIAQVSDGTLELRVLDQGPGVPAELRERIFEPFFTTKDKRLQTGGMGLGLALVRRTVTAAHGQIRIGDNDTGGAEFIVTVPFRRQRGGAT